VKEQKRANQSPMIFAARFVCGERSVSRFSGNFGHAIPYKIGERETAMKSDTPT
jgi:hypothetical protein